MIDMTSWSPVCCHIGPIAIYWYGVAYVIGIILALAYAKFLLRQDKTGGTPGAVPPEVLDAFLPWLCAGIVVGGRLGHVLFFDLSYYLRHPLYVLNVREGGMAFHGGLLGVLIVTIGFCRKHHINLAAFCDVLAVAAPIGLGLGRLANFINGELYGLPTHLPWGTLFRGVAEPRHPTQIYEALTEGLLTALILRKAWKRYGNMKTGMVSSLFLVCYALCRFCVDFLKDTSRVIHLTIGQILSLGMFMVGVGSWVILRRKDMRKL